MKWELSARVRGVVLLGALTSYVVFYIVHEASRVLLGVNGPDSVLYGCHYTTLFLAGIALRSLGPPLYLVGISLNNLVKSYNGGRMPVWIDAPATAAHSQMNEQTRLAFLGDWIHVGGGPASSPGDILLVTGLIWLACDIALEAWEHISPSGTVTQ